MEHNRRDGLGLGRGHDRNSSGVYIGLGGDVTDPTGRGGTVYAEFGVSLQAMSFRCSEGLMALHFWNSSVRMRRVSTNAKVASSFPISSQ